MKRKRQSKNKNHKRQRQQPSGKALDFARII